MKCTSSICVFLLLLIMGCQKDPVEKPIPPKVNSLADSAEKFLAIAKSKQIYFDESQNAYIPLTYDVDHKSHIFGVFLEKGKKYHISISAPMTSCNFIDFRLLTADRDTLFTGEQGNVSYTRSYICWTSNASDTFYVAARFKGDINFHTYNFQMTFEEVSTRVIQYGNLNLMCSGDWFINPDGYLTLAGHQTQYLKWAKVMNDSLNNYDFSYQVSPRSGIPDSYIGIACYASKNIFDMMNMPQTGYVFDITGPASWRIAFWHSNGTGYDYGPTPQNLGIGVGSWNKISVGTFADSLSFAVNNSEVLRFRNISFMDNGLYITVEDTKNDTLYFKDLVLIKK